MKNPLSFFNSAPPVEAPAATGVTKEKEATPVSDEKASVASDTDSITSDAQDGVRRIQALSMVWSKKSLILAYCVIWLIYFCDALHSTMSSSLLVYVTSSFYSHSLTSTTFIVASLIGGLVKLPLAKVLDIWGRPQGFAIMLVILTIGLILTAACDGVKMFAAAQVFYYVGYNGISYSMSIFIADTTQLKNRALIFAFVNSPFIITCWIAGHVAQAFLDGPGWRWAYGAFAIITPICCSPLLYLFWVHHKKAKDAGILPERKASGRSFMESVKYYLIEFDVAGLLLLAAGLALFLLSFSIYSYQADQWKSPLIICFIIFGGLLIIAFAFYEKYWAPVTFIPYQLLVDRTVLGACVLAGALFISFYIWNNWFRSFLMVVNGLTVAEANYVTNIYSVGSCLWSFVCGYAIRRTGRFKWCALYFGVPLTVLGIGLMIHFRQPDMNVGYIIMCQIFIAVSGGTLVICEQIAVMAVTDHQHIAVVLAIEAMFASVGGAIGSTVASAIWTGTFPKRLALHLPAEALPDIATIYASIVAQLSFPEGSPVRKAIQMAYGDAQRYMLIAATAIHVISFISVLVWRDVNVNKIKQVKGNAI